MRMSGYLLNIKICWYYLLIVFLQIVICICTAVNKRAAHGPDERSPSLTCKILF